ncbi:LADA_0H14158g1_1 [Lachancea dasiensis]|uniref:Signal peptidase complex subunit 2 n=1 Tax=Lachancea dasiensis TaxID=1072105 RepID=A0A1G4K4D3_9SACH|nr:LADA_0H14158g1_1 [Lachancea dasiensis]
MSKPINVYSTPDLRQTLDEALPATFERLGFTQSFKLIDTKLFLGYSIALIAGISFMLDKKWTFEDALTYQKILVGAYVVLSVVFWYFSKYVEKGVKYSGSSGDRTVVVATKMEKHSVNYEVTLRDDRGKVIEAQLAANTVFNEAGYLQSDRLFKWFEEFLGSLVKKAQ